MKKINGEEIAVKTNKEVKMKRINGEEIMVKTKLLMKNHKFSFEQALAVVALEREDYWNKLKYDFNVAGEVDTETIRGHKNV